MSSIEKGKHAPERGGHCSMYNITRDVSLYYIPIAKRNRKGKKRFSFYTFLKMASRRSQQLL